MIAGVSSAVAAAVLIGLSLWLRRRRNGQKSRATSQPLHTTSRDLDNDPGLEPQKGTGSGTAVLLDEDGLPGAPAPVAGAGALGRAQTASVAPGAAPAQAQAPPVAAPGPLQATLRSPEQEHISGKGTYPVLVGGDAKHPAAKQSLTATTSIASISTAEQAELGQYYQRVASAASVVDEDGTPGGAGNDIASSTSGQRGSRGDIGLGEVVLDAAKYLAHHCQIPGVSEAASVVSTLVTMVSDRRDIQSGGDSNLRQCRSVVRMLERASKVAGRVSLCSPSPLRGFELCLQGQMVSPIFSKMEQDGISGRYPLKE